jgi:hypothetical protein
MSRKVSETSAITSPTRWTSPAALSRSRLATAVSVEQSRRSLAWSVSTRFSSSGIARSKDRMPASTWPVGMPARDAASAPASVELVSPNTSTMVGSSSASTGSSAARMRAVCAVLLPPPAFSSYAGAGTPSSSKKMRESSSS